MTVFLVNDMYIHFSSTPLTPFYCIHGISGFRVKESLRHREAWLDGTLQDAEQGARPQRHWVRYMLSSSPITFPTHQPLPTFCFLSDPSLASVFFLLLLLVSCIKLLFLPCLLIHYL